MTEPLPKNFAKAMSEASDRLGSFSDRLSYFSVVSSTNDVALKMASAGADDGTTVLAMSQTSGRGRRGREWFSPTGVGLYFSSVLRGMRPKLVTLMAGVAVVDGIRTATQLPVELRWPNDIVLPSQLRNGREKRTAKLGGILTETSRVGELANAIVVGIGINIGQIDYPLPLRLRASSLEAETGHSVNSASVFVESLVALAHWREVMAGSEINQIFTRWYELSPTSHGTVVTWNRKGNHQQGITDGLDTDGALLVRCGHRVERLVSGEFEWCESSF